MSRFMTILGIFVTITSVSLFKTTSLLDKSFIECLKDVCAIVSDAFDDFVTPSEPVTEYQRQPSQSANQSIVNTRSSQPPKQQSLGGLNIEYSSENQSIVNTHSSQSSGLNVSQVPTSKQQSPEGLIIEYSSLGVPPPVPGPLPVGTIIVAEPIPPPPPPVHSYNCACCHY